VEAGAVVNTLAILALVFWVLAGIVFADWKRSVTYPARTFSVVLTTVLAELSFAALALWVILR
jgi:hypothetical protein